MVALRAGLFLLWIALGESMIRPRNDDSVDSLFFVDCFDSAFAESRNDGLFLDLAFKTTEGFSVWLSWFLANLGREARLGVCERPKFTKNHANAILKTNCPKNSALFIKP